MISFISGRLRPLRASRDSEDGFTLIELMIASGIILIGLVSLMYGTLVGLADIATARQRQSATSLVNQTMEQLRAVSQTTLSAGMNTTDLANSLSGGSTPDPAISTSGGKYYFESEQIPTTGATQTAPLSPHQTTKTVGTSTFNVFTYVTYYQNNAAANPPTYRATVVVTWTGGQKRNVTSSVRAQSLFYSPGDNQTGCASASTHQYRAPCQAYFYALASSGQGQVHLSGTVNGISDFTGIDLDLPKTDAALQTEQLVHAQASALTSGAFLNPGSSQTTSGGQVPASVAATNDPNNASYYNTTTASGPASVTLSDSQGLNVVGLTSSAGDTAAATATTSAGKPVTYACNNASGTAQLDGYGCANANVRQLNAQTASVTVNPSGLNVATAQLVSVAGEPATTPSPQIAYVKKDVGTSNCTGNTTLTPPDPVDGCTDATQTRHFGNVDIGSFPAGFSPGSNWAGYLVRISNFNDSVFAQSGQNPASPAATANASGTISYWNGTNYTTQSYSGTQISLPAISATATAVVGTSTLTAILSTSNLVTGATSVSTTATGCGTSNNGVPNVCAASATSGSPILGDVNFTIGLSVAGVITSTLADVDLHVDLGTLQAQTSYTPST